MPRATRPASLLRAVWMTSLAVVVIGLPAAAPVRAARAEPSATTPDATAQRPRRPRARHRVRLAADGKLTALGIPAPGATRLMPTLVLDGWLYGTARHEDRTLPVRWDLSALGAPPVGLALGEGDVEGRPVLAADGLVIGIVGGADGGRRPVAWDPVRPDGAPRDLGLPDGARDPALDLVHRGVLIGSVERGTGDLPVIWDLRAPDPGPRLLDLGGAASGWVAFGRGAALLGGVGDADGGHGRIAVWDLDRPAEPPIVLRRSDPDGAAFPRDIVGGAVVGDDIDGGLDYHLATWDPATPGARPSRLPLPAEGEAAVYGAAAASIVAGVSIDAAGRERVVAWDLSGDDPRVTDLGPVDLGSVDFIVGERIVGWTADDAWTTGRVVTWRLDAPDAGPIVLGYDPAWTDSAPFAVSGPFIVGVVEGADGSRIVTWDSRRHAAMATVYPLPEGSRRARPLLVGGGRLFGRVDSPDGTWRTVAWDIPG